MGYDNWLNRGNPYEEHAFEDGCPECGAEMEYFEPDRCTKCDYEYFDDGGYDDDPYDRNMDPYA